MSKIDQIRKLSLDNNIFEFGDSGVPLSLQNRYFKFNYLISYVSDFRDPHSHVFK